MKAHFLLLLFAAASTWSLVADIFDSALQKRQLGGLGIQLPAGISLSNLSPSLLLELAPLLQAAAGGEDALGRYFGEAGASKRPAMLQIANRHH